MCSHINEPKTICLNYLRISTNGQRYQGALTVNVGRKIGNISNKQLNKQACAIETKNNPPVYRVLAWSKLMLLLWSNRFSEICCGSVLTKLLCWGRALLVYH